MRSASLRTDVRLLFRAALATFVVTVVIGVLDGQGRLTLNHGAARAHAQAGTLGWITLGVLALALLLFGTGALSDAELLLARALSRLSAVGIPAYVLALLAGIPWARVALGAVVLLAILLALGWVGTRVVQVRPGVAHVAVALALLALTFGATLGLLQQFQSAIGRTLLPGETADLSPMALVAGYLLLVGMAVAECRLLPPTDRPPLLGLAQVVLASLGAGALVVGILVDMPSLFAPALVLQVGGVALFAARLARRVARVRWLERGDERHYALGAVFLALDVALYAYVIGAVIAGTYDGFGDAPPPLMTAIGHLMFVGAISNALFGLISETTGGAVERRFWPAADDILFWGMNLGLLGFLAGLLARSPVWTLVLEGVFTPILGASLLVGIVAHFVRLQRSAARVASPIGASRP